MASETPFLELMARLRDGNEQAQRTLGLSWKAIGQNMGGQPDALRMKFKRALDRVALAMGLEGAGDGRS
jgi:hypothetical protein